MSRIVSWAPLAALVALAVFPGSSVADDQGVVGLKLIMIDKYGIDYFRDVTREYIEDSRRYAVGRIRTVPPDGELVASARAVGIAFGNE